MRIRSLRPLALVPLALACTLGLAAQHPTAKTAPAKAAAAPAKLGPGTYAVFETNKGNFTVQLFPKEAPKAVQNFIDLAQGKRPYKDPLTGGLSMHKYYEDLLFFRSVPGVMLQTGDELNNGQGSLGYTLPFEKNNLKFDQPGRMALAQVPGDPSSRGPQVFFTLRPVPSFDQDNFLIIGQIVEGLDVANALSQGPRRNGANDLPQYPNTLQHVIIKTVP